MREIERVSIIGLGAIGAAFAAEARVPEGTLRVIAGGARGEKLRRDGMEINGRRRRFTVVDPSETVEPADLLIIAVKFGQLAQAIEDSRNHVGDDTVILSVLNGISSEEVVGRAFGREKLLYSYCVGTDAMNNGDSRTYSAVYTIPFGEAKNTPGAYSENVLRVQRFFERANIKHEIPEDMLKSMWWKFMMNMGVNQSLAVTRQPYRALQHKGRVYALARDTMLEAVAVAQREGIALEPEDAERAFAVIGTISPDGKPSTLQDIEAKRPTEIEIFSGDLLRLAEKHGMSLPVNEVLYRAIKGIEQEYTATE
ncbi:MAG: ketopantoate reductase family protein [Oscillospiraceae bacterium]|jgi:2-dehydropantoate 2-reductase|nr:ketopantoate reductase family protein [Oscillospiraceae bacterium]